MIGIPISILTIALALWLVARHDAEIDIKVIALIAVIVGVVGGILSMVIGVISLPIMLIGLGWSLVRFCNVNIPQAAIVSGIWLAVQIGLALLLRG